MCGFYPILDTAACAARGLDPILVARVVLEVRPPLLQLRAKAESPRDVVHLLRTLRPMTRASGTALFANDRPDLAILADCDGVHLGQDDLPIAESRRFAPQLRVGLSTHDLGQLDEALAQAPDYVAFGPIFSTSSKADASPTVGMELLQVAGERCRKRGIPLTAIGGIGVSQLGAVAPHVDFVAMISGFLAPDLADVEQRCRDVVAALAQR